MGIQHQNGRGGPPPEKRAGQGGGQQTQCQRPQKKGGGQLPEQVGYVAAEEGGQLPRLGGHGQVLGKKVVPVQRRFHVVYIGEDQGQRPEEQGGDPGPAEHQRQHQEQKQDNQHLKQGGAGVLGPEEPESVHVAAVVHVIHHEQADQGEEGKAEPAQKPQRQTLARSGQGAGGDPCPGHAGGGRQDRGHDRQILSGKNQNV